MKTHTNEFKTNISKIGRQLNSKITYELNGVTIELGETQLNSITPHYKGDILKSVMKQLDIDSKVEIPIGTIINYQFGVRVNRYYQTSDTTYKANVNYYTYTNSKYVLLVAGTDYVVGDSITGTIYNYQDYDYLDYGNYIVKDIEKQEDLNSFRIVCYDKMLYTMTDYIDIGITYPITVRNYLNAICTHFGLTFANASDTFVNYNKEISSELYLDESGNSLGYKFRDILDELAQATASTICINEDDELEIRYITETNDTINEDFIQDIKANFGQKYGPINSIVLSRTEAEDNIYLQDTQSIQQNGLCEIKIKDNQIMNFNNREEFLQNIFTQLNGLEYYINDFSSIGIMYYELYDRYTIHIDNNNYSCVMLNDEALITDGLRQNIHTDMPIISETDYSKADKTDRRLDTAYMTINKQERRIDEVVSQVNDTNDVLEEVRTTQTAQERKIEVISSNIDENGNITEVTTTTGFTFNASGMHISGDGFEAIHNSQGTYYKDGDSITGQYTKDGSKQKDLELFGTYSYGKNSINDTPMFVAQLYTDENGEEGFGHFYNGGDI